MQIVMRKRVRGEEHPSTVIGMGNMGNLASALSNQGQAKEAELLDAEVMEIIKKDSWP